jgi:hypothetical protein
MDDDEFEIVASEAFMLLPEPILPMDLAAVGFTFAHDIFGAFAQMFLNLRNCAIADALYQQEQREFRQAVGREIETITSMEVNDG